VLMDHRMPDMDGVEATRRIRALAEEDPYYQDVPIVALTANAVSGMKEMFLQNGFNDFVSKPIDTVRLNRVIEKWIPKRKQKGVPQEFSRQVIPVPSPKPDLEIEGVDIAIGMQLSGGTRDYYLETLALFQEDGRARIEAMNRCVESDNLPLYVVHAHGLKSALANIGATSLSEDAFALETAGLRGNIAVVRMNNGRFIKQLEQLVTNIGSALTSGGAGKDDAAFDDDRFKAELVNLKTALEEIDIDEMNRTVDELLRTASSESMKTAVRNISKHVLLVEYDEAEALIDSLL